MYERAELAEAQAHFWQEICTNLWHDAIDAPESLSPEAAGDDIWTSPDLVLSQTCGYPFRTRLYDKVKLVGTPDYELPGCPPGYYNSHIITHGSNNIDDLSSLRGGIFALNSHDSQSGYIAALHHLKPLGVALDKTVETGAHRASVQAVAERKADLASIDAVSWRFMKQYDAFCDEVQIIATTKPTPGLPYITATGNDSAVVAQAVSAAIEALSQEAREILMINQLVDIPASDYLALNKSMAA